MNQPFLPPSASTLELRKEHEDDTIRGQVYNQSSQTGHKAVKSSRTRRIAICVALHAGLVLVHAGLFVVWSRHYEHVITVDIDTAASIRLPLIMTVVSQVIGTVSATSNFLGLNPLISVARYFRYILPSLL